MDDGIKLTGINSFHLTLLFCSKQVKLVLWCLT